MKSVFIIHSDIFDRYQKYAYFFNWFEDHKDVSLCIWNKYASDTADIDELVPQLFDTVKNVSEWNAYIIDEPFVSDEYIEKDFEKLTQCALNPYERAGHSEEYDPAKDPLMRLTYYLGGRGVEELEYLNHYNFKAVRPTQIIMITPRIFENLDMQKVFLQNEIEERNRLITQSPSSLLTETDTSELEYSDFWLRYEYPPNCRFLVFDMPDIENVLYEDYWFLFWMSVLTLALNKYNSSELGAYKLYKLEIDISKEEFKRFINKYYLGLQTACEVAEKDIENEITALKAAKEDTTCHHPEGGTKVFVGFPDTDFSKFYLSCDRFGTTKDVPTLDEREWAEYKRESSVQIHRLFKGVARGKNEAVDSMNRTFEADMPMLLNQRLTRYDLEDLLESLNASELKLLRMKTGTAASRAALEKKDRKESQKVEKAMRPRVRKSTYIKLTAMCVGICLAGFIPFIISSAQFNATSFLMAALLSFLTCGIVAGAGFLALKACRTKFGNVLEAYSVSMMKNLEGVKSHARVQSAYLTALLDYMEKYQMIKSGRIDESRMKQLEKLTAIRGVFEDALDQCRIIASLCNISLSDDIERDGETVMFLPGTKIYLHDDTEGVRIALGDQPDRLETPFIFIESLNICEETLYGSSEYYAGANDGGDRT